jgi:hypothetical protein
VWLAAGVTVPCGGIDVRGELFDLDLGRASVARPSVGGARADREGGRWHTWACTRSRRRLTSCGGKFTEMDVTASLAILAIAAAISFGLISGGLRREESPAQDDTRAR